MARINKKVEQELFETIQTGFLESLSNSEEVAETENRLRARISNTERFKDFETLSNILEEYLESEQANEDVNLKFLDILTPRVSNVYFDRIHVVHIFRNMPTQFPELFEDIFYYLEQNSHISSNLLINKLFQNLKHFHSLNDLGYFVFCLLKELESTSSGELLIHSLKITLQLYSSYLSLLTARTIDLLNLDDKLTMDGVLSYLPKDIYATNIVNDLYTLKEKLNPYNNNAFSLIENKKEFSSFLRTLILQANNAIPILEEIDYLYGLCVESLVSGNNINLNRKLKDFPQLYLRRLGDLSEEDLNKMPMEAVTFENIQTTYDLIKLYEDFISLQFNQSSILIKDIYNKLSLD